MTEHSGDSSRSGGDARRGRRLRPGDPPRLRRPGRDLLPRCPGPDAPDDRRPDHRGRGRRPQPAPARHHRGARLRRAARRSPSRPTTAASGGTCASTTRWCCPTSACSRSARPRRSRRSSAPSVSGPCSTTWSPSRAPGCRGTRPRTSAPGWPTGTRPPPGTSRRSAPAPAVARRWSTSSPARRSPDSPMRRRCWPARSRRTTRACARPVKRTPPTPRPSGRRC